MQSIEEKALSTYQSNLNYFAQKHPKIYKKINLLNMAIESGQYKEKYALEYKDGYFDIQELSSKQFIYNTNSDDVSKKVAKEVNFTKTDNVIETFYRTPITKEHAQVFNDTRDVIENSLYATSSIIYYANQFMSKKNTLKKLEKYIFFGVGTGKHIEMIQEKIKASKVLIIENDLELFKLSLFTIPYFEVFETTAVFYSLSESEAEFKSTFDRYFTAGYNHNQFLKYTILSDNYIDKIKIIQNFIITQDYITYPYSIKLRNLLRTPTYLIEGYNYMNISKQVTSHKYIDKPVILIAAGPSLQKNIEWLKLNQNKFIIVTALAALQTLDAHDIKPDVVVNIDSSNIIMKFFQGIDIDRDYADTPFLFSSMVNQNVVNKIAKDNIYFFESTTNYKKDFGTLSTPSIGETIYGLLLIFGFKNIYLLGLDLALDPDTKQLYSNKEYEPKGIITDDKNKNIYNTQLGKSIIHVRGNFLESVPTLPLFKISIFDFAIITNLKKSNSQNVYNLNNGAFLEGSMPTKINDINMENISDINKNSKSHKENLLSIFQPISEKYANINDIKNLQKSISEADRLYKIVQIQMSIKSYSSLDSFMINLARLINELIGKDKEDVLDINNVMYYYIRFISPYIFDLFNTKELSNHKKHIKYINKTLLKQIEKMLVMYIQTLKVYIVYGENRIEKNTQ